MMRFTIKAHKKRPWKDHFDKKLSITYLSFACNLCMGLGKLLIGIVFSSYWFIIAAGYYITLCMTRGHLLYSFSNIQHIEDQYHHYQKQFAIYHRSGYFLIILGITYFTICVWMYYDNQQTTYPDYIIYGVAAMAFYKIGTSIYSLLCFRKDIPILSIIKIINIIDACVSIIAVQCALLTMQNSAYATSSSAILGIVFSVIFMLIGIFVIHKKPNIQRPCHNIEIPYE